MRPIPDKVTILVSRFSYDGWERVEVGLWMAQNAPVLMNHPRVAHVVHAMPIGYPTDRVRNQVLGIARENKYDYVLMLDADMAFDAHAEDGGFSYGFLPKYPGQVPFLPSALDFALDHPGPCVVAAPYCSGPPEERVLVSRFAEPEGDCPESPGQGVVLAPFAREEAATRTGFEQVPCLPTGLMLIDVRVTDVMGPPWFAYEYKNVSNTELASTEDTVFTRNLHYLGVPCYVAWDSWAGHVKEKIVGRPRAVSVSAVPRAVREGYERAAARERRENYRPPDAPPPEGKK